MNNYRALELSKLAAIFIVLVLTVSCGTIESNENITDDRFTSEAWKQQFAWLQDQEDTDFLLYVRRLDKAESVANQAIVKANKFGAEDPRLARSLTSLGRIYIEQGNYKKALEPLEKSRDIKTKKFGKNNPDVADILTEISYAHINLGNLDKAKDALKRANAIREAINDKFSTIDSDFLEGLMFEKENKLQNADKKFLSCINTYNERIKGMPDSISTQQINRMVICFNRYLSIKGQLDPKFDKKPFLKKLDDLNRWLNLLGNSNA